MPYICRQIITYLAANLLNLAANLMLAPAAEAACTGGGSGLHRSQKVFVPVGERCYSPNLTLKNCAGAAVGGVTSIVVITALFLPFTSTPLVIGEAESSPATVSAR